MNTQPAVTIFSQPGCPTCMQVKSYLQARSVGYTERDITTDEQAMAELFDRGFSATPLTLIGDLEVLGFNRPKLESAIAQFALVEVR